MSEYAHNTKWKYLINRENGKFIIFPETISHDSFCGIGWNGGGFLAFELTKDKCENVILKAECYGKSVSMKLESSQLDASIINSQIKPDF